METKSGETETTDELNSLLSANHTHNEAYILYSKEHKAVLIRLAKLLLRGMECRINASVTKLLRRELRSP